MVATNLHPSVATEHYLTILEGEKKAPTAYYDSSQCDNPKKLRWKIVRSLVWLRLRII